MGVSPAVKQHLIIRASNSCKAIREVIDERIEQPFGEGRSRARRSQSSRSYFHCLSGAREPIKWRLSSHCGG